MGLLEGKKSGVKKDDKTTKFVGDEFPKGSELTETEEVVESFYSNCGVESAENEDEARKNNNDEKQHNTSEDNPSGSISGFCGAPEKLETFFLDLEKTNASEYPSDKIDDDIKSQSEKGYIEIVGKIVDATISQLQGQNESKKSIRKTLLAFFITFLILQYVSLFVLLMFKGLFAGFGVSDGVILAFITSVFVETLGGVIIMVSFAFESKQENQALKILHGAIKRYKKFGDKDSDNETSTDDDLDDEK